MKVVDKRDNEKYEVYDISYDNKTGYPRFLIYKNKQWLCVSARHFKPVDIEEEAKEDFKRYYMECLLG